MNTTTENSMCDPKCEYDSIVSGSACDSCENKEYFTPKGYWKYPKKVEDSKQSKVKNKKKVVNTEKNTNYHGTKTGRISYKLPTVKSTVHMVKTLKWVCPYCHILHVDDELKNRVTCDECSRVFNVERVDKDK